MPLFSKILKNLEDLKYLKGKGEDAELKRIITLVEGDIYATIIGTFYETMMNLLSRNTDVSKELLTFLDKENRKLNLVVTRGSYISFKKNLSVQYIDSLDLLSILDRIEETLRLDDCERMLKLTKEEFGIGNVFVQLEEK